MSWYRKLLKAQTKYNVPLTSQRSKNLFPSLPACLEELFGKPWSFSQTLVWLNSFYGKTKMQFPTEIIFPIVASYLYLKPLVHFFSLDVNYCFRLDRSHNRHFNILSSFSESKYKHFTAWNKKLFVTKKTEGTSAYLGWLYPCDLQAWSVQKLHSKWEIDEALTSGSCFSKISIWTIELIHCWSTESFSNIIDYWFRLMESAIWNVNSFKVISFT